MRFLPLLLVLALLTGCTTTRIAIAYKNSELAQKKLNGHGNAKILLVRYYATPIQHAYCVWQQPPYIYAYDERSGSFATHTKFFGPMAIAESIEGVGHVEKAGFLN
jgi:hypothetical protein